MQIVFFARKHRLVGKFFYLLRFKRVKNAISYKLTCALVNSGHSFPNLITNQQKVILICLLLETVGSVGWFSYKKASKL